MNEKLNMKQTTINSLLTAVVLCMSLTASAQEKFGKWYFGLSEGIHIGNMSFSDVNDNVYDSKKCLSSPLISVFVQGEFGSQHQFAVRPEVAYLRRGGKLTDFVIGKDEKADYILKSHYVDLRLSFIYNFLSKDSKFRPYVFVTPRLGFSAGGEIKLESKEKDIRASIGTDLSDANMASTYFSVAPGVGARWNFHTGKEGQHTCWLGIEASYEFGLTDTYSSKEKDSKAIDILGKNRYVVNGTRKLSGFEVKAVLGIPFSVFCKSKPEPVVVPMPEPVVETEPVAVEPVKEKPCYTLDEIIDMMLKNEDVTGKTICAIDAINFDFNQSTIKAESYDYLNKLAATLIRINTRIKVKGHTDNIGTDEVNMNLSKERAQAVMNYLLSKGVSRSKLSYDYYGSTLPLTTNETEEGRAMNRRVEIEILK